MLSFIVWSEVSTYFNIHFTYLTMFGNSTFSYESNILVKIVFLIWNTNMLKVLHKTKKIIETVSK